MSTVTERFKDAFDSSNQAHVKWLAKFFKYAKNIGISRSPIDEFINTNPMRVRMETSELMDWIHVHFILAMKYAQDVLDGKAWTPPSEK